MRARGLRVTRVPGAACGLTGLQERKGVRDNFGQLILGHRNVGNRCLNESILVRKHEARDARRGQKGGGGIKAACARVRKVLCDRTVSV
jgi:hypothetical protein